MLSQTRKVVMESHIEYLCDLHELDKLYISTIEAAEIWIKERVVWVPKITGPVPYYVALHEIGHYITYDDSDSILEKEARAWQWALETGKIGPTKSVYERIRISLKKYLNKNTDLDMVPLFRDLYEFAQSKVARKI